MVGKKKVAILLTGMLLTTGLVSCSGKSNDSVKKIGVIQLANVGALDEARVGFEEGLKEKGYEVGKNIEIDYQNAQGDIGTANTIAQQFVNSKKDLVFAIATPAAQAVYNNTKDIPIVFTAVTDPVSAGLAKDWKSSGNNVTGTSDMVNIKQQLETMKKVVPDMKKVGIIYSTSEANSKQQVEEFDKVIKELGLEGKKITVTNVNEIDQNLTNGLKDIDVLYVPTDNTVVSGAAIVTKKCLENKVPILAAEEGVVKAGGLCTVGISYKEIGKEAAYKAVEILEGKKPAEIEITKKEDLQFTVNVDAAKALGITIPEDLKKDMKEITGGVN